MTATIGMWPTPLQRSSTAPGLVVKREDLCGFGFGGAKVRLLPRLLEQARAEGATALVTGGRWNSNWVPLAVMAAVQSGLAAHAVFDCGPAERPPSLAVRLAQSLGAQVYFVEGVGKPDVRAAIESVTHRLLGEGERPYVVARAGRDPVAAQAYSEIIEEVAEQLDWPTDVVFHVPVGSGGVAVGLALGLVTRRLAGRVVGVAVTTAPATAWSKIVRVAEDMARPAGVTAAELIARVTMVEAPAPCPGRSKWPRSMQRVVDDLGLLLDPVFAEPTWRAAFSAGSPAHGSNVAVLMASGGVPSYYDQLGVFDR